MPKPAALALAALAIAVSSSAHGQVPQANDSYFLAGEAALRAKLQVRPRTGRAKNVILFVGDGMGITTITPARIYEGQAQGVDGESFVTAMDALPFSGLVKTYTSDAQVADSAPTATALTTGAKTRNDVIGVDQSVPFGDCAAASGHWLETLFEQAEDKGLATGVVTTARLTHATPAAAYAHTPHRDWENDSVMPEAAKAAGCVDIARQFLDWPHGDGFEVAMGGGRSEFMSKTESDPEDAGEHGLRSDGRDLIDEWRAKTPGGVYVWNQAQFDAVDPKATRHLLGLFERDHMEYGARRGQDAGGEPSLADMTRKAIAMLQTRRKGYVLMVEAGRIDHAHHANLAGMALDETARLDEAVKAALEMVDPNDTLVIVTSDHSHNLSMAGYPRRGNPILGTVVGVDGNVSLAADGQPYTTLSYANGPGAAQGAPRRNPAGEDTAALTYIQPALVPFPGATHGGEDVAVRAIGPWAHLLTGVIEQNFIYHVMAYALRLPTR